MRSFRLPSIRGGTCRTRQYAKIFGGIWHRERRSALLPVPSILARTERNILINPLHRDVPGITRLDLRAATKPRRYWRRCAKSARRYGRRHRSFLQSKETARDDRVSSPFTLEALAMRITGRPNSARVDRSGLLIPGHAYSLRSSRYCSGYRTR
jgi:hypothetical protein